MSVWRLSAGGVPPIIEGLELEKLSALAFEAKVKKATLLVHDINQNLVVSVESSDYRTKSTRLKTATDKLAELKTVVNDDARLNLTKLQEIEKHIANIERDLFTMQEDPNSDGALWVFLSALELSTPTDELHLNGLMFRGAKQNLAKLCPDSSRSRWHQVQPTFRELGIDLNEWPRRFPSCIGGLSDPVPFVSFLLDFRKIIESGLSDEETELQLENLSSVNGFNNAVFSRLGPSKRMMKMAGYQFTQKIKRKK